MTLNDKPKANSRNQSIDAGKSARVAALAVVIKGEKVLLVRRQHEPDAKLWGFPGGHLEHGETILQCAVRELAEEAGIHATAGKPISTIEVIRRDEHGGIRFHFLMIAVKCEYVSGEVRAADDVTHAQWVGLPEIKEKLLPMSKFVDTVTLLALDVEQIPDNYLLDTD